VPDSDEQRCNSTLFEEPYWLDAVAPGLWHAVEVKQDGHVIGRLEQKGLIKRAEGSVDKAYDFLNAVTDPGIAAYLVDSWGYGSGNAKGMATVDPAVLQRTGYADVEKFTANTLFQSPVPSELKQKMIAEFEKIKSGY